VRSLGNKQTNFLGTGNEPLVSESSPKWPILCWVGR